MADVITAANRTCACGHGRTHPEVQQEPEYTFVGWLMLSIAGMTPVPDRIAFRCIRCRQVIGFSRDPKLLHKKQMPGEHHDGEQDEGLPSSRGRPREP